MLRRARNLPPPAPARPAPFGSIVRRTTPPPSRLQRALRPAVNVLLVGAGLAALFLLAHGFFRHLIFGGL